MYQFIQFFMIIIYYAISYLLLHKNDELHAARDIHFTPYFMQVKRRQV